MQFSLSSPWALHFTGIEGLLIRICTGAPYWIKASDKDPVFVDARDIAMLPHGGQHVISSHEDVSPATNAFSLYLWLPSKEQGLVIEDFPPLILLHERRMLLIGELALAMEVLVNETVAQGPDWQLSAARMADLLLAHVLCEHMNATPISKKGWLYGVANENIACALALIHEQAKRQWSLTSLADACHLSRAVFSERFRDLVGTTPINYLSSFRMTLAVEKLKRGQFTLRQIAEATGYKSEKNFSKAFHRWAGITPSTYLKRYAENNSGIETSVDPIP